MRKNKRFLIGGLVILGALSYIMYGGMQEAMVYFKMPSELKSEESGSRDKFLRMGGMVVKGSLQADVKNLTYRFDLSDGMASIPVLFKGIPPDLFTEGKGAVVEGRIGADGVFRATTIMAKHAEEYSPHADGKEAAKSFIPAKEGSTK
jgi:cytochrome c-type biogenesis protein CcmE